MNINDITITSLETINAFDLITGEYKFTLDELQNAKIANTQDKVDITGKGGRKLSSLKRNKAVVVSGTNGMVSGGLLEMQTGSKFSRKTTPVLVPEFLTVSGNKATTTYAATGTEGNEIEKIYIMNAKTNTLGVALEQGAAVADGVFTYDPDTKEISLPEGVCEDGAEIAVYYFREIQADVLENLSDVYSDKCTLYIDAFAEDKCGNILRVQFFIPKADFSGNFDIDLGENQTVHAFEAESLAGACGKSGSLWTYTVFGEDEDAA